MDDGVHARCCRFYGRLVPDIAFDELDTVILQDLLNIAHGTADKVVEDDNLFRVFVREKLINSG